MITLRIQESLRFWWRHLGPLFLVTVPFSLITEAVSWWRGPIFVIHDNTLQGINIVTALLTLAVHPFAQGALIAQLAAIQSGRPRGLGDCLLFSLRMAPVLVVIYLFIAMAMYAGLLLLILPGLWLYGRFCLAPLVATLESRAPPEALRESLMRTRTVQWQLLAALVLLWLMVLSAVNIFGAAILSLLGDNAGSQMILTLVADMGAALVGVLIFRFYVLSRPDTEVPAAEQSPSPDDQ